MSKKAPKANSYEDSDLEKVLTDIEELEAEKASIMAEAAGRCSGIAKRIANEIKTAKALGIPVKSLNALRKVRKLERKIEEAAAEVPDDEIELFEDMTGQFSWLQPEEGESAAHAAAEKVKTAAQINQEQEQAEGADVLNGLAGAEAVH